MARMGSQGWRANNSQSVTLHGAAPDGRDRALELGHYQQEHSYGRHWPAPGERERALGAETIDLLGVNIHALTVERLHGIILESIRQQRHDMVLHVNIHCMNLVYQHSWLRPLLNQARVVFCDGAGIMLGARLLGRHIPQRITYADWMWQLVQFAVPHELSFFFLGGRPGVADQAAERLRQRHPELRIAGTHHGFFDQRPDSDENQAVIAQINAARAHILLVGFGQPLQERWLLENWQRVEANVALTGGAVFDYISGQLPRAPRWMTEHSMEWLGRLLIEPRRLWQRYLLGNPLFLWRICQQRMAGR